MRGLTLDQKRYGPGFRPGPLRQTEVPWTGCSAMTTVEHQCTDPVVGKLCLWVDETPPPIPGDWYLRLLQRIPPRVDVWVPLCQGHFAEACARSIEDMDSEKMWAPGATNPSILPKPPLLIAR